MATQPPLAGIAAVVDEVPIQHVHRLADAKELSVVAQFHVIVRCWCRRAGQPESRLAVAVFQQLPRDAVHSLENRRFIQHDAAERGRVKLVQLLIVNQVDAVNDFLLAVGHCHRRIDAELLRLAFSLAADSDRAMNHDRQTAVLINQPCPFELLKRLAQSAFLEQCRTPSLDCPLHRPLLPVKQIRIQLVGPDVESVCFDSPLFPLDERFVIRDHSTSPHIASPQ